MVLDEFDHICDADRVLVHQLHLEHDIVPDADTVPRTDPLDLVAGGEVATLVVLELPRREDPHVLGEIIKGHQQIVPAEDRTEELDEIVEVVLGLVPETDERELGHQFFDELLEPPGILPSGFRVSEIVVLERTHDDLSSGFVIGEQGECLVDTLLHLPEADDVPVVLDAIQDTVGTGERLDQTVVLELTVHPEGVEGLGIETGEEHVHDDQDVQLAVLHLVRDVLVVVLEPLAAQREVCGLPEEVVVILHRPLELGLRVEDALDVIVVTGWFGSVEVLVVLEGVDDGDLQVQAILEDLLLEDLVVLDGQLCGTDSEKRVESEHPLIPKCVRFPPVGLGVVVGQDVIHNVVEPLRIEQGVGVDGLHHLVLGIGLHPDSRDIIDLETKDIVITDGIYDGVCVKTITEAVLRGKIDTYLIDIIRSNGILGEYRGSGESEEDIILEGTSDRLVHRSELGTVTFIEYHDHALLVYRVRTIRGNEPVELLDGGDDDPLRIVIKDLLQHPGVGGTVDSTFLELLELLHALVVEVLPVDDEEDLVELRHLLHELSCLEGRQRLAASGGVPNVTARFRNRECPGFHRTERTRDYGLCSCDLIGAHHEELLLGVEDAVSSQDLEDRVLCQERHREVHQVLDVVVLGIGPE